MTRPIDDQPENWIHVKEAAYLTGRRIETVYAWVHSGAVPARRQPGNRLEVFKPALRVPVVPRR